MLRHTCLFGYLTTKSSYSETTLLAFIRHLPFSLPSPAPSTHVHQTWRKRRHLHCSFLFSDFLLLDEAHMDLAHTHTQARKVTFSSLGLRLPVPNSSMGRLMRNVGCYFQPESPCFYAFFFFFSRTCAAAAVRPRFFVSGSVFVCVWGHLTAIPRNESACKCFSSLILPSENSKGVAARWLSRGFSILVLVVRVLCMIC